MKESKVNEEIRERYLIDINNTAKHTLDSQAEFFRELKHKAEMILISWAFIFSGIIGMFQVELLYKDNTVQFIALFAIMFLSISLAVSVGIFRDKSLMPDLDKLWIRYYENASTENGFNGKSLDVKENIVQQYINMGNFNEKRLRRNANILGFSGLLIILEVCLLLLFSLI